MKKQILRLAATVALAAMAVVPASAHRQWMMPSATVLSGDDVWVTVDAAECTHLSNIKVLHSSKFQDDSVGCIFQIFCCANETTIE